MRYIYESTLPRARAHLDISGNYIHNAAGLEEIYRRNVQRNKYTSVKNVGNLNFIRKCRGKYACARTGVPLQRQIHKPTAFKSSVFPKCPPNKFKFCYANLNFITEIYYEIPEHVLSCRIWVYPFSIMLRI